MVRKSRLFNAEFEYKAPLVDFGTRKFMETVVKEVAEAVMSEYKDLVAGDGTFLDVVSGIPGSGYRPCTDGGCEVVIIAPLSYAYDNDKAPVEIQRLLEVQMEACDSDFYDMYGYRPCNIDDEVGKARYEEFVREWRDTDDTCYFFKVRCTQKDGKVRFLSCLNTDYGYGRDTLLDAGLPDVEPNPVEYRTEADIPLEDIGTTDAKAFARDIIPLVIANLHGRA